MPLLAIAEISRPSAEQAGLSLNWSNSEDRFSHDVAYLNIIWTSRIDFLAYIGS